MYESFTASVIWYLSWPVLIFIMYKAVRLALNYFEKKHTKTN